MTLSDYGTTAVKVKHPLHNHWRLYLHQKAGNDVSWDEQLKTFIQVETVEDFWAVVDHLTMPSHLTSNCAYYFFKNDIFPAWEHPANAGGLQLNYQAEMGAADTAWIEVLLCLIGNKCLGPLQSLVNGAAILNRGNKVRLQLWCSVRMKEIEKNSIKRLLRQRFTDGMGKSSDKSISEIGEIWQP